jgi:hypothetical protein
VSQSAQTVPFIKAKKFTKLTPIYALNVSGILMSHNVWWYAQSIAFRLTLMWWKRKNSS